jgi:hypothetical protein
MTGQAAALTRHDLEAKIVKRCWEDEAFSKQFTADPAGAFVKYLEIPAASLPKIVIHEESAGSWHIVLPSRPPTTEELSAQQLEKVAGGAGETPVALFVAATGGALSGAVSISASVGAMVSLDRGW